MVARACSKCGALKVPAEFHRAKRYALGRRRECRDCVAVRRADYYSRNGERERAGMARWREANYDYDRERWRRYSERRWADRSAQFRARCDSPTKRCVECDELKPKTEFYACGHTATGRPHLTSRCKRCWNAYTEPSRLAYKARKLGAATEVVDLAALLAEHGPVCHICNGEIAAGDLHWDHVVPLSRGGAHSAANLRPAHSRCNLQKHDKLMEELPNAVR